VLSNEQHKRQYLKLLVHLREFLVNLCAPLKRRRDQSRACRPSRDDVQNVFVQIGRVLPRIWLNWKVG
jgi:hypothetical protein